VPILAAAYPVIDTPNPGTPLDPAFVESRGFSFRSLTGEDILPFTGDEFIARWGIQGLDVPPRQLVEEGTPNRDGSQVTDIKVGSRTFVIPIFVGANSGHLSYLRHREVMRSFFNFRGVDYKALGGTFDLVASSAVGQRSLRSFYVDGMNGQWDQETSGVHWETFGLQGLAQWPYWDGGRWSSEIIRRPGISDAWFGAFPSQLAPNNLLNATAYVNIEGDVESYVQVDAVGPTSNIYIECDDYVLDVPDGLADGERMTIDADPRSKRILFDGVQDWSRLSPLTSLAPLSVGSRAFELTMDDPGPATQMQLSGVKWYETPW
jgi:hypothetical protein